MRTAWTLAVLSMLPVADAAGAQEAAPIRGFPDAMVADQHEREALAHRVPSPDSIRDRIRLLSAEPHEAGTERSRRVAERILERFRGMGLEAWIEEFEAYMPVPVSRELELVAPEGYAARLAEPPLPEDEDSYDAHQLPTFNAYAADGDVTAELVYVNYGVPEDYEVLDSLGISVEGRIVIARYGVSWRGIKPKVAAERGAVGCIIFSDPRNDGYWHGDTYPDSTMRPSFGVQRGSVMDLPVYPGDPLTPGWASEAGGRKLPVEEARTIMTIPVLPISYGDALPLLRNLAGPVAPEAWRGALPITYHVGPGPATVRLALRFEWRNRPLYDVIARIPGRDDDAWVLYGNHHDAWVNGAHDPISGLAALEETARSLAELYRTGWRPRRTILFTVWDGEEWGLLGSTEWAEKHRDELREKGVAYLNSDINARGPLYAAGVHSLEAFAEQVVRDVRDPDTGRSVLEARLDRQRETLPQTDSARFQLLALGAGTDFTAFLDHVGMAAAHLSYGGATRAGVYHSVYDSFTFYRRFLDPGFRYGVTEARTMATALMRLADAPLLPFEFTRAARTYRSYVDEIRALADRDGTTSPLDLAGVRSALDRLEQAASAYEEAAASFEALTPADVEANRDALDRVNRILARTEQALTSDDGLPLRPWYRHLIYAPGYYTGYGVKTMAGIREAVDDMPDPERAQREAARVAEAIERYAERVEEAAEELDRIGAPSRE